MVLVSLDNGSTFLSRLGIGSTLGVNVLAGDQGALASHFAVKRDDKFTDIPRSLLDGVPSLPRRHPWIMLTTTEHVQSGGHALVLGPVETAALAPGSRPLIYWRHTFGRPTTM